VSARRPPSDPPALEGFDPIELIGSGGYADVFLFQQHMPSRRVAVKVLVGDVVAVTAFTAEANLMARVSAHPYIVGVYDARVTADGRPYLVMEYYPGLNFLERARSERFSIADALRSAIQVASAVETAHRVGILHRDIKPANILTSEYGRPGLTDFGIASAGGHSDEAEGVSIPWSPPEAFGQETLDARADVYALAATTYHLLSGRSPFEIPGGRNGALDLMSRIERERVPSIGRADVPPSLERLLVQAMSKDAAHRPASAAEFARSLQAVESELRLATTPLELPDVSRVTRQRDEVEDDDATRVRGVTEIQAQPDTSMIAGVPMSDQLVERTVAKRPAREREGMPGVPDVAATVQRPAAAMPSTEESTDDPPGNRTGLIVGAAAAFIVVVALVGFVLFGGGGSGDNAGPTTTVFSIGGLDDAIFVSGVDGLSGVVVDSQVTFSWEAPSAESGDVYVFERTIDGAAMVTGRTEELSVSFDDVAAGQEVCLDVIVRRSGAADSAAREACVKA
jgi:serine/threonine protein kinase